MSTMEDNQFPSATQSTITNATDTSSVVVAIDKLTGKNYWEWARSVKLAIQGRGKVGYLTGEVRPPPTSDAVGFQRWKEENSLIMSWLTDTMVPSIKQTFLFLGTAKDIWEACRDAYSDGENATLVFDIKTRLWQTKQGDREVIEYYLEMLSLWQELDAYSDEEWKCADDCLSFKKRIEKERVFEFLAGLNKNLDDVRSRILARVPLPSIREAVDEVRREEARKKATMKEEISSGPEVSALVVKNTATEHHEKTQKIRPWRPSRALSEVSQVKLLHAMLQMKGRLKKEQEEKEHKKQEKAEANLYTVIKVARDEDLAEQIGRDIYFDLVDHDKVRSFRVQKQMCFNVFKEEVAKEFGIPVQFLRFWLWAKRQNHTYRPHCPLTHLEETQSVGQLREVSKKFHNAELKLFLEVELGVDLRPIAPPVKTKGDILLFFKLYDPEKEELRYVGRLFVKSTGKPSEILTKLNDMAGYDHKEEIALYEEIKFEPYVMCEPINKNVTFRASQLEDGDIICFQKAPSMDSDEHFRYPYVLSYLEYVHDWQVVHFRSLDKPKEDDFCLEMSRLYTYDDVVERVAQQLGLDDPSKIRLTPHNCYSQQPKPQPIKYRGVEHLSDMLVHYNQTSDILYYEVLDIPLPELQGLKTLKVAFNHATKDEVVIHTIRLPKKSTVGDVLDYLKTKVELSHPYAELRLFEVFHHKIYKVFPPLEKIENINDQYWTLRVAEIPEEEKNLGPLDRLIHVYHFTKDTAQNQMQIQNFGDPFILVIREGEILANIKVRVQQKLNVPDKEFARWKFAFVSLGRPEYLSDSDIVSSRFQRRDVYGAWEQYLGLEHADNAP